MFIINRLSQHVSGTICPSSREQDCEMLHMVFSSGCAGRGRVEQGRELCALTGSRKTAFSQCTQLMYLLHMTTTSTTSAEHHTRHFTILFS
jgi:hypothetical protein